MFFTVINDCRDDNAIGRQAIRISALISCPINFIGVSSDLEAAGNIIDALDAAQGARGVILANVAPRHGKAKKWQNGTPFGYFYFKKTLVIAAIDGLVLSLVKKLRLAKSINILDLEASIKKMQQQGEIKKTEAKKIISSQFRSYEFLPRAALWLLTGHKLPGKKISLAAIADAPKAIWWIDNFGNCKTTILASELNSRLKAMLEKKFKKLSFCRCLKDVEDKKTAVIVGSSGIGENRFLEIIIQGGNIANKYKLKSGDKID